MEKSNPRVADQWTLVGDRAGDRSGIIVLMKLILEALENVTSVEDFAVHARENPRCRDLEKSCEYKSLLNSLFFSDSLQV